MRVSDEEFQMAAIERRRREAEERRIRFLNHDQRTRGVNLEAIQKQLDEKQRLKQQEKQEDQEYREYLRRTDELLERIESERQELKHAIEKRDYQVNEWMKQNPQLKREWHLNNPEYLKNSRSTEPGDVLGVSSLQRFDGEDLQRGQRLRQQQDEIREFVKRAEQQKQVETMQKQEELKMENSYQIKLDEKLQQLQKYHDQLRREREMEQTRWNLEVAQKGRAPIVVGKFQPEPDFFSQFGTSAR